MKLFHIVSIIEKSGDVIFMTRYPMAHAQACEVLKRFTSHKHRRLQLLEAAA